MKQLATWLSMAAVLAGSSLLAEAQQMVKSERTEIPPEPGKALVIFVRSSMVVGAYSSPVVHIDVKSKDPAAGAVEDRLVGILSAYSKVAYQAEPGEHTFLSVAAGGSGHVVKALLDPGKTYYILVRPIWGFVPSFSLHPFRKDPDAEFKLDSSDLAGWLKRTDFYEPTPAAQEWMNANRPSVTSKKNEALEKWKAMSDEERRKLTLLATDTR